MVEDLNSPEPNLAINSGSNYLHKIGLLPPSFPANPLPEVWSIMASEKALALLQQRLCDPSFVHSAFKSSPSGNYCKLKFIISNTITEVCNNSVLLLGPRGCGKGAVVDLVLEDLTAELPEIISVIRLNGILHVDDNCALKEIARQLCMEHNLLFSKMASFDDNSQFMIDMLSGLIFLENVD